MNVLKAIVCKNHGRIFLARSYVVPRTGSGKPDDMGPVHCGQHFANAVSSASS